jgi:hypothetical protein
MSRKAKLAGLAVAALLAVVPVMAFAAAGPPTAATAPSDSSVLTDTYALISGVVNPHGTNTNYYFEWGTTTAYGQATPVTNAGSGTADVPVDVSLDGLAPSTTYHFRVVAAPATPSDPSNPGLVYGNDEILTTTAPLTLFLTGGKTAVVKRRAQVKVKCVGPPDEVCRGRIHLSSTVKGRLQGDGSGGYAVATGKSKTIAVSLTPAARQALKAAKSHHLLAEATAKTSGVRAQASNKLILIG